MPLQKSQMHRLMRIAALLKENRYPNSETLVKEFRRIALEEELEIDCGKKDDPAGHEGPGGRIPLSSRL